MKLQAGDRIWLDKNDYFDLECYICHNRVDWYIQECDPEEIEDIIINQYCHFLGDNYVHIFEQLYCEEAFPWQ